MPVPMPLTAVAKVWQCRSRVSPAYESTSYRSRARPIVRLWLAVIREAGSLGEKTMKNLYNRAYSDLVTNLFPVYRSGRYGLDVVVSAQCMHINIISRPAQRSRAMPDKRHSSRKTISARYHFNTYRDNYALTYESGV